MDPIVSTDWLADHLADEDLAVCDVRWRGGDARAARQAFEEAHIPGSIYLDLESDLADVPEDPRLGGRHPLPSAEAFCEALAAHGVGHGTRVVCVDDMSGAIGARLWWMLHWIGHEACAVLDGGISRWKAEGREIAQGPAITKSPAQMPITPHPNPRMVATKEDVLEAITQGGLVLDARSFERYRGENETIDPVGGHIAGAISAPFSENLDPETGCLLPSSVLRDRFRRLGVCGDASDVICHCGSGVTACHNILAMARARMGMPRLYVGSWSEWCRDPRMPRTIGPRP